MKVKLGTKVIPASFLKIEGTRGARPEREGRIEELVGGQNPGPIAPPKSRKRQEKKEQRRCQGRSNGEGWVCQVY